MTNTTDAQYVVKLSDGWVGMRRTRGGLHFQTTCGPRHKARAMTLDNATALADRLGGKVEPA